MNLLGVSVRQGFLGSVTLHGTGCAAAFGAGLITDGRLSGTFSRCRAFLAGVASRAPRPCFWCAWQLPDRARKQGPAASRVRSARFISNASVPLAIRLTVVSCPATTCEVPVVV